jgi:hypothetical protein
MLVMPSLDRGNIEIYRQTQSLVSHSQVSEQLRFVQWHGLLPDDLLPLEAA